jgi:flagellar biosynthesis/type III secretory pathway M-ring protein FliF/YscJ
MEMLRTMLTTVRQYLGRLNATQKLLIASVAVIMVMALLLVGVYAGKPQMVELLKDYPLPDQTRASAFLTSVNIPAKMGADGKVLVPADRADQARAALAENGKLPSDKTLLFNNLVDKQNWINSRQQNEQIYLLALQNQLAADISNFKGVKAATVILDIPEAQGLGKSVRKPTAVATVTTSDGRGLAQATVDAVAGYVAGSRSGLDIDHVRVIDASTGRQRKPTSENELVSSTYIEHAAKIEAMTQEKLSELLKYIPGVIIAVTAQVDVTRVNSQVTSHLPAGKGTLSELSREREDVSDTSEAGSGGGEPGPASNVSMDINRGDGTGASTKTSKTEREYGLVPGTKVENVVDPKGMPTVVAVSVNVPHGFVAGLIKDTTPAPATGGSAPATTGPSEKDIADQFEKELKPRIEAQIRNHVRTMTTIANSGLTAAAIDKLLQDAISVTMIPMDIPMTASVPQTAGLLAGLTGGASGGLLGSGLIDKAILGVLGIVSLGMMFTMVKRAGKKVDMPTAEELVGVPPMLDVPADIIGEADEMETAMQGIEMQDDTIRSQQILEQVGKMVGEDPVVAAKLINRWMSNAD